MHTCTDKCSSGVIRSGYVRFAMAVILLMVSPVFSYTQVQVGNIVDFTPSSSNPGTVKSWTMPFWLWTNDGVWRTQFAGDVHTYNSNYGNRYRKIAPMAIETGAGIGGVVWHFKSSTPVMMNLKITPTHYFGSTGSRNFDIYYSDVNDWSGLSPMTGGTWAALESNSKWVKLYSDRAVGGSAAASGTLEITTDDGNFWVRTDMASTDGGGETYVNLNNLVVSGTVVAGFPQVYAVPSISALRALLPIHGDGAMVMGYYAPQDDGGGFFYFDSASIAPDDGGMVIAPNSGSGRWLRSTRGELNVKYFGAKGDGIINDTTAIQNALSYAGGNGNIPVYISAGTYLINSTLLVLNDPMASAAPDVIGSGAGATIIQAGVSFPASSPLIDYKGGSGGTCFPRLQKIHLKGSGRQGTLTGVRVRDLDSLTISQCKFSDLRYGVRLHNEAGFTEFDTAQDCEFVEVGTTMHFYRSGGFNSHNNSGLINCVTHAYSGTPVILVQDASGESYPSLVYNSPMDFAVSTAESGAVIFNAVSPTLDHIIYGNIRIDGEGVTLANGVANWWHNGSVTVRGNDLVLGKFYPRKVMTLYTSGPFAGQTHTWESPTYQEYTLQSGTTALVNSSVENDISSLFYVDIYNNSNYDYRYLLSVTHDGGGSNGYANIIATIKQDNGSGAGAPSFTVNANGQLQITNGNYSSSYKASVYKTPLGAEAYPKSN